MKDYDTVPSNSLEMTEEELHAFAERTFEHPKTLLEIPLVLIPESLFQTPRELRRKTLTVQSALDRWLGEAKEDDQCLRIERRWIPYAETYIPDTPEGIKFFEVAHAFGQIPMEAGIVPRNQDQGYWLKTLHYFYQACGILFAYKLLGVISNPISQEGLFTQHLSSSNIRNLEFITDVDLAEYKLIEQGENYIRQWLADKNVPYPFDNPLDLFLEIKKQSFLQAWELGPNSKELEWLSVEKQQDLLAVRIRLLEQQGWIKRCDQRETYDQQRQEYINFLENNDWYGCFILALRSVQGWELPEPWKKYTDTLKTGKPAYIDDFYWQDGQPYKARTVGTKEISKKTRKTRSRQRVEGATDSLGYLIWRWA